MTKPWLSFQDLSDRHPGVTKGLSESYAEAARVCLDRHHASPADFVIDRASTALEVGAQWMPADECTKRGWANDTDATEAGAYGLALAAVEITDGLVAVSRAETRTGADYYLGEIGEKAPQDLEKRYRLEVSGVDKGKLVALKVRLRQKLGQAARGACNLPALATVVGFSEKMILSEDVEVE